MVSLLGGALAFAPSTLAPRALLQSPALSSHPLPALIPSARRVGARRAARLLSVSASSVAADEGAAAAATTQPKGFGNVSALFGKIARLGAPFWSGPNQGKALVWTVVTVLLALVTTIYSVSISFVQKFFWNALNAKDVPKFNKFLLLYLAILTVGPPLLVLFDWCKGRMALAWRNDLTTRYLGDYVDKMRYYKLPLVSQVDNTDQRIAEDISNFCEKAVTLFCTCIVSVCDLVVFSVILYKIYPPLFAVLIGYATIGTTVTIFFGRPLIAMNRQQVYCVRAGASARAKKRAPYSVLSPL
jgi:ABC-type uncharacterized transport system fused permease/ATPase subunit